MNSAQHSYTNSPRMSIDKIASVTSVDSKKMRSRGSTLFELEQKDIDAFTPNELFELTRLILLKHWQERRDKEIEILLRSTINSKFFQDMQKEDEEEDAENPSTVHRDLCQRLSYVFCPEGQTVFDIGTIGQTFYIILQGSVGVWIRMPNKRNELVLTEVKVIEAGSSFGELALLSNKPRAATIMAKEDTHLAVLEKKDFQRILKYREEEKLMRQLRFLSNLKVFSHWNHNLLQKLLLLMELKVFSFHEKLYSEDDSSDAVYIVKSGELKVKKQVDVTSLRVPEDLRNYVKMYRHGIKPFFRTIDLSIISRGELVGVNEVLKSIPRQTTVECITETAEVYYLSRKEFVRQVLSDDDAKKYLKEISQTKEKIQTHQVNSLKDFSDKNYSLLIQSKRTNFESDMLDNKAPDTHPMSPTSALRKQAAEIKAFLSDRKKLHLHPKDLEWKQKLMPVILQPIAMKPHIAQRSSSNPARKTQFENLGANISGNQIKESLENSEGLLKISAKQPESSTLVIKSANPDNPNTLNPQTLRKMSGEISFAKKNLKFSLDRSSLYNYNTASQEVSGIENSDTDSSRKELTFTSKVLLHSRIKPPKRVFHPSIDIDDNSNLIKGSLYALAEVEGDAQPIIKSAHIIRTKQNLNLSNLKSLENINDHLYIKESLRKANRDRKKIRNGALTSLYNAISKNSQNELQASANKLQSSTENAIFITNPKPFQYLPVYVKMGSKEILGMEENSSARNKNMASINSSEVHIAPKNFYEPTHHSIASISPTINQSNYKSSNRAKKSLSMVGSSSLLISK